VKAVGAANAVGAVNASKRRVRMDGGSSPAMTKWKCSRGKRAQRADDLLIIENNCLPAQPFVELDLVVGQVDCPGLTLDWTRTAPH
jgi:hypothetical protein